MNKLAGLDSLDLASLSPVLTRDSDTAPRWQPGERLHHLFEAMVDRQPDAVAVETPDGPLTFAALENMAARFADRLRAQGLGAGDVIALLFGRSPTAYAAMLAVLKIHAAYVPLDPAFPADRLRFIAEDAKVAALLTTSEHAGLAAAAGVPVLRLDVPEPAVPHAPATAARDGIDDSLAYIIYTSGSTGRPKGVLIEHAAIVHFVRVATETYGYRPGDRVYQGLTLAFDFSVEEIWVPLLAGATLVPSCARGSLVGADLHAFLRAQRITALCCVPTLLATIEEDLPDLRLLIVSGEACPDEIVRRWHRPGRVILNAYGPTETTVTATTAVLEPGEPVTLGTPLPGYIAVILDPEAPVALPRGDTGEIGIAGIGLSPGYLGRDDLTRKAFVPDFLDLPDNPSGRIYRTGDLGRVNERGQLEYLGRIDTQVKIRGYRIELSEIESLILQQPGVAQAVVNTFEAEPGMVELVAYYTATGTVTPEALATALEKALPSYMVPAFYEKLETIAMLPSDKADRKALPPQRGPRLVRHAGAFVAPETETETRLAAILADLLKLDRVSATDDFFADLGANSLLMARFSTRVRRELGAEWVSMREIYGAPNVRALAAAMDAAGACTATEAAEVPEAAPEPHVASALAYWGTGAYQAGVAFVVAWAVLDLARRALVWLADAGTLLDLYGRAVGVGAAAFLLLSALPIVAKWLLIGRWRESAFPIWGFRYARFWTVRTLIQIAPLARVPGTPLFNLFLKSLGARVDWRAMVMCPPPICTDLIEIGRGAVVGREVVALGYRAEGGRILTGPIRIGEDAHVGDGAVLDIRTELGPGAEVGHASALLDGQSAAPGCSHGGVPAVPTSTRFRVLPSGNASLPRLIGFTCAQLCWWLLVAGPMGVVFLHLASSGIVNWATDAAATAQGGSTAAALPAILGATALFMAGTMVLSLARVLVLPRLAWLFLCEDRTFRLFGLRHFMLRAVTANSNSRFFNMLFGDSSFIVHYLRAIGYRFPGLKQTGSNFGVEQRHDVPFLCEFGSGTMVSDNLLVANAEFSNTAFRLGHARFGQDCFLGNDVIFPYRSRTGSDVLFGTRVMVPVDGPVVENGGILGAPAFPIPRSVSRDHRFDALKQPGVLAERLRLKNRSNIGTMGLFLASRYGLLATEAALGHLIWFGLGLRTPFWMALSVMLMLAVAIGWVVLWERAAIGFGHLQPQYCSIYDRYFWRHERYWKLMANDMLRPLYGTPFVSLAWRGLGVKVGRNLFDDGCGIVERTLTTIGDNCTLNFMTTIQPHSLEEGTFKSDHIVLGDGVTLGVRAFVHYGTVVGDEAVIEAGSFLMKGETPLAKSRWGGNPARPVGHARGSALAPERTQRQRKTIGLVA